MKGRDDEEVKMEKGKRHVVFYLKISTVDISSSAPASLRWLGNSCHALAAQFNSVQRVVAH